MTGRRSKAVSERDLRACFPMRAISMLLILPAITLISGTAFAALSGAIYATNKTATIVNGNTSYAVHTDVYISGGPLNLKAAGLPDGIYYFQVTDASGATLLSTDDAVCRQLLVVGGRVAGSTGPACKHAGGTFNPVSGVTPVQVAPFSNAPNDGDVYKAWMIRVSSAIVSGTDPKVLNFSNSDAQTDNFKVPPDLLPQGSCQPSSSLSVMVQGTNVTSYVPKASWDHAGVPLPTGVSVINIEGSSVVPTLIATDGDTINSCGSNPITGDTVCTANNNHVWLLSGTSVKAGSPLASSASGTLHFIGGRCSNCGVAMDAFHNKAAIPLSLSSGTNAGFQFLNLATSTFEPAFASLAPTIGAQVTISAGPLIDPMHNRLLSPSDSNNYELIDITTTTTPAFFEHAVTLTGSPSPELDSAGADCKQNIILASVQATFPTQVFIADLTPPVAVFTPGTPGTWTAPSQVQTLTESSLGEGGGGIAMAQGTSTLADPLTRVLTGDFGGNSLTAIKLPATSGTGAIPALSDWVTCKIPDIPGGAEFFTGYYPHSVTAYTSPNIGPGHAIALVANNDWAQTGPGPTIVARIDLTAMLDTTIVPRTALGHACSAGILPASVVTFVPVP